MRNDSPFRRLARELRRRSLFQVLSIYLVSAWIAYQVILDLVEGLGLPEWFPSFAVILFLAGLPMVLATAYVQERSEAEPEGDHAAVPAGVRKAASSPAVGSAAGLFTWRHTILGGVAAMALWGVFAAGWLLLGGGSQQPVLGGVGPPSVAVLPFSAIGADSASAFGAGVHEDVITQLSRIRGLKVISRTSVLRYADRSDLDLREVGEELGVSTILEGSVRRHGNRVRIVAQLIDAGTDAHLWADSYDRDLEDVFAIQSEIAREIADALAVTLSPDERARLARRPTEDRRAYELFLQGRHFWHQRTPAGIRNAIDHFQAAIDRDASYADAWAGLADAYVLLPYYAGADPESVIDHVRESADRALELDPGLSSPHATLALIRTDWDGDLEAGEASYRRALELNPGDPIAHHWLALNLWFQGRIDEALAASERAAELDPLAPVIRENLIYYLTESGRPQHALEVAAQVRSLSPGYNGAEDEAAIAMFVLGDLEGAEATLLALPTELTPLNRVILARILAADGRTEEVREVLRRLEERARSEFISPAVLAEVARIAGEDERAAEYRRRLRMEIDPWRNFVAAISRLMDQRSESPS